MEIESKYKIPLQGEYWKGINSCPVCGFRPDTVTTEIIGFADSINGLMTICECPECFAKWYFHCRINEKDNQYFYFIEFIKNGYQKHYKCDDDKREFFSHTIIDPRRK